MPYAQSPTMAVALRRSVPRWNVPWAVPSQKVPVQANPSPMDGLQELRKCWGARARPGLGDVQRGSGHAAWVVVVGPESGVVVGKLGCAVEEVNGSPDAVGVDVCVRVVAGVNGGSGGDGRPATDPGCRELQCVDEIVVIIDVSGKGIGGRRGDKGQPVGVARVQPRRGRDRGSLTAVDSRPAVTAAIRPVTSFLDILILSVSSCRKSARPDCLLPVAVSAEMPGVAGQSQRRGV